MECKAHGEAKYRSNLMVVRILARRATKQSAFYSVPSFGLDLQLKIFQKRSFLRAVIF